MSEIVHVTDHADEAEAQLPEQYKGLPNLVALARLPGDQYQDLEDVFWDLLSNGSIALAHDGLLDQIGDIVGQPRMNLSDADYRTRIYIKIAENVSRGTVEDLIRIFKALMQADKVWYRPVYPAGFSLTAINGTPLGSLSDIYAALNTSRLAGVNLNFLALAPTDSFSFFEDPDPDGLGFGDADDGSIGGTLAEIL